MSSRTAATPNHSFNRTLHSVPAFDPPFHSGPNTVPPFRAGELKRLGGYRYLINFTGD